MVEKTLETKFPVLGGMQIAYAFNKYIHGLRPENGRLTEAWNKLDEEAYKVVKTGMFELKKGDPC